MKNANESLRDKVAGLTVSCAVRALLYEVSATPKPGLVDRANSGSHKDMDFFTFLDSSAALIPYFRDFFCLGWDYETDRLSLSAEHPADDPAANRALFAQLRLTGQEAEKSMFAATGGVNTHKGLIFSSAIVCAALGKVHAGQEQPLAPADSSSVIEVCKNLGKCSLADFSRPAAGETVLPGSAISGGSPAPANGSLDGGNSVPAGPMPDSAFSLTAGERLHALYGISGARGEAAAGFPSGRKIGLPALKKWLSEGYSLNDSAVLTLLTILSAVDDTNMIHRGGRETALACKKEAAALLSQITAETFREKLTELDAGYIRRNLSPGGCADLLAVSLMFYFFENCGLITPLA